MRLKGSCRSYVVWPSYSSPASQSELPRIMFRWLLDISKGRDSTTFLGCLCQCSVTPTVKKCFLMFRGNPLCFSLCHGLWSCHWTPLKEPGSVLFAPSFQVFIYINNILLSFHFPGWTVPALSAFPHWRDNPDLNHLSESLLDSLLYVCHLYRARRTGHNTAGTASPRLTRGERSPPLTCWKSFVQSSLRCHWPSWKKRNFAGTWTTWYLTGPLRLFLQNQRL